MNRKRKMGQICRIHVYIAAFCIAVIFSLTFIPLFSSAHERDTDASYTYYQSIEIQYGDTLWDIAEKTRPSDYKCTAEYVEVLKEMNGLKSDYIQAGQHLIIAYTDSFFS